MSAAIKDEETLQADLDRLSKANLVFRQRRDNQEAYIFRHALIRDAAYDGMVSAHRKSVHAELAEALKRDFGKRVDANPLEITQHYAKAEAFPQALAYGDQALNLTLNRTAYQETVYLSESMLTWVQKVASPREQQIKEKAIRRKIMPALDAKDWFGSKRSLENSKRVLALEAQLKQFEQPDGNGPAESTPAVDSPTTQQPIEPENAAAAAEEDNSTTDALHASQWQALNNYHFHSQRPEARELALSLEANARQANDEHRLVGILPMIGQVHHTDGAYDKGLAAEEEALRLYDQARDAALEKEYLLEPKTTALILKAHMELSMGYPDRALRHTEEAVVWAKANATIISITLAYLYQAMVAYLRQEKDLVAKIVAEYREHYGEQADSGFVSKHLFLYGDWSAGNISGAEVYHQEILESQRTYALSWYEPPLADLYLAAGQVKEAIELMENALVRCEKTGEKWALALVHTTRARCFYAEDQTYSTRVDQALHAALEIANGTPPSAEDSAPKNVLLWHVLEARMLRARYLLQTPETANTSEAIQRLQDALNALEEGKGTQLYQEASAILHTWNTYPTA